MMRSMRLFLPLAVLLLLVGCQQQAKPMYYWGDYTQTYYDYAKTPSEETLAAHEASLVTIIAKSEELGIRIPPGVYAEYGFIQLKKGQTEQAVSLFTKEKTLYPESTVFMDRLIQRTDAAQDSEDAPEKAADSAQTATNTAKQNAADSAPTAVN